MPIKKDVNTTAPISDATALRSSIKRMKNSHATLWSDTGWEKRASWIEKMYWDILKRHVPNIPARKIPLKPTEHRIERFVRGYARKVDQANVHVGLTSSDLEDNVRIWRLHEDFVDLRFAFEGLMNIIWDSAEGDDIILIAYTHLMPAGVTTWKNRVKSWGWAGFHPYPKFVYKGIQGAIGDGKIQKELGIDVEGMNDVIFGKGAWQHGTTQTVNHHTEYDFAAWIAWHSAVFAKLANDMRQMFALGQARHTHHDVGSTAIPAKAPNPWRYERASAMLSLNFDLPGQVARIAADCLLERTLTNQSALSYLFDNAYRRTLDAMQDLVEAFEKTEIVDQTREAKKPIYHSEELMLEQILRGVPRERAHERINKIHARKP